MAASASSPLRVFYTVQGEHDTDTDTDDATAAVPNCFLMDRPPSGLLKAHDVLSRFPPAAAAAEVGGSVGWNGGVCGDGADSHGAVWVLSVGVNVGVGWHGVVWRGGGGFVVVWGGVYMYARPTPHRPTNTNINHNHNHT